MKFSQVAMPTVSPPNPHNPIQYLLDKVFIPVLVFTIFSVDWFV